MNIIISKNRPPSRWILKHPLEPPIHARLPVEFHGGGVGVAAEIKTGYATLSRNI